MLFTLALSCTADPHCTSPLGKVDANCDGRVDDDFDGDGATADVDCDDSDAELNLDDPDEDGFTTCTGDCDQTTGPDTFGAVRGPRGVVAEECDGVDNDCNDVIDVDDRGESACRWSDQALRPEYVDLDLLLVVDTSGSMAEENGRLQAAGASLLEHLVGTDTHLGLVPNNPTLQGRLHGSSSGEKFLDLTTVDADQALAWWLEASEFTLGGSFTNAGLDAAYLAIDDTVGQGSTYNLGFRRDEAPLAIVFVSDSDDHSTLREADTFGPWMTALASLSGRATAYGILPTDIVAGCGVAEIADNYLQVIDETQGQATSVCDANWGGALAQVAADQEPVSVVRLDLSKTPIPATLAATVVTAEGLTVELAADELVYEPDVFDPRVLIPNYLWVDLDSAEVRYEVLPDEWDTLL